MKYLAFILSFLPLIILGAERIVVAEEPYQEG